MSWQRRWKARHLQIQHRGWATRVLQVLRLRPCRQDLESLARWDVAWVLDSKGQQSVLVDLDSAHRRVSLLVDSLVVLLLVLRVVVDLLVVVSILRPFHSLLSTDTHAQLPALAPQVDSKAPQAVVRVSSQSIPDSI